jgi:fermentation-respiration switch protein FrsA (DUF1100 family)
MLNWILPALVVYVGLLLLVMWREKSFIYYPERELAGAPPRAEDVWLTTADGVRIHGWFVPAETNTALTVLFCHGNAGNISHRFEKLDILRELGANVLIFDYRGYGRSEGSPDEQGTYRDAQAAYDSLAGKTVVVYGESLGAAVAVDLAAKNRVAGVVIEEAFTSAADVGRKMFPYLPVGLILRNRYDSLSKIGRINAPLLIFHSRDDEFFSMRHAERLLDAAREPKRLVELRGGHNDAFIVSGEIYRAALAEFLRSL